MAQLRSIDFTKEFYFGVADPSSATIPTGDRSFSRKIDELRLGRHLRGRGPEPLVARASRPCRPRVSSCQTRTRRGATALRSPLALDACLATVAGGLGLPPKRVSSRSVDDPKRP